MLKKAIFATTLAFSAVYGESCWTTQELSNFAMDEFSGKTRFSIKDSVTCKPVSNADFYIGSVKFTTDAKGLVEVPLPPEDLDKDIPITIKKDRYITAKEKVMVWGGSYWNNLFLMSKSLPINSARFVLSWGEKPADLDLHLKANHYHISFRNVKSIANKVKLDRDARKGYGPETITLDKLDKNDNYRVLVNRYNHKGNINNKAQLRVYLNNKLDKTLRLKNTNAKCVEIATISNNKIKYNFKELKDGECR